MGYGFDKLPDNGKKTYLRRAGLHLGAKFVGLYYTATEQWEAFNIDIETSDGQFFSERTFGPTIDKVYPKQKWIDGKPGPMETPKEALERVQGEISNKLYQLALCFVDKETLQSSVKNVGTFKELVDKVAVLIGNPTTKINFLTIWKNSDAKQKSNLILADRIKWVESHVEGVGSSLKFNRWQLDNQLVEKYPYQGTPTDSSSDNTEALIVSEDLSSDLPF